MVVLSLIALVMVIDQTTKWWAWRHIPWAKINPGGDILVSRAIGAWYAAPVTGALLDLLSVAILGIGIAILVRCRANAAFRIPGALMIGGWGSNVLDRLGLHYLTAPDSVRGVVDFIHVGGYYYNVADFFIIGATPLFVLALAYEAVRWAMGLATAKRVSRPQTPPARRRVHAWLLALVGAGLVGAVALGATHYGSVNAAACSSAQRNAGQSQSVAATEAAALGC